MDPAQPMDLQAPASFGDFLHRLFTSDFMPHGHCYFWRPEILWLHVISDALTALAYYSIPVILLYFLRKRKDVPFHRVFLMFSAFIFLCGTTHIADIVTTWIPAYRIEGIIKLLTAVVSVATALYLIPIMPKAVAVPRMESMIRELSRKTRELADVNIDLERFNRLSMGREKRIVDLKKEVNAMAIEAGRKPPYDLSTG